jgi:hypothetical protein
MPSGARIFLLAHRSRHPVHSAEQAKAKRQFAVEKTWLQDLSRTLHRFSVSGGTPERPCVIKRDDGPFVLPLPRSSSNGVM